MAGQEIVSSIGEHQCYCPLQWSQNAPNFVLLPPTHLNPVKWQYIKYLIIQTQSDLLTHYLHQTKLLPVFLHDTAVVLVLGEVVQFLADTPSTLKELPVHKMVSKIMRSCFSALDSTFKEK